VTRGSVPLLTPETLGTDIDVEAGARMDVTVEKLPNQKAALQERRQAGQISWAWPVILLFARFILAVIAQATVAGAYMLQGHPTPWQAAAPWWIVYGTAIDIVCLVLLWRLARREGVRLWSLVTSQRKRLGRDLLMGLALVVPFALTMVGLAMVFTPVIYGDTPPPAVMIPLPLWAALYSLLVWPVIWAFAEEMTYLGYSLPRLEVLSGRAWPAVLMVSFGWGLQHCALPIVDWRWAIFRFAVPFVFGIAWSLLYLRTRRLLPLIVAHWAANTAAVLMLVALPSMTS
jgi:membrane protease YdiL (CAAX protease family)